VGKIAENGLTKEKLAEKIQITPTTLGRKLNGQNYFTQRDIVLVCKTLGIPASKIPEYFFAKDVQ
jgi:transcriptional regulator with XRE-family HTH domain